MVQPILLNRTDTDDTDPPLLNYGELAVATGPTYTKMWLGDGAENRALFSDDPADTPLFGGAGGGNFLPLTGGDLTGPLTIAVPATTPALTVGGRGIIYSQLNATNTFSFFANGAVIIPFVNGVAGSGFINVSGGNMTGALALSADPINPMQAATKQYVDTMLPLAGGTLTGPLVLAGDATAALNPVSLQQLDASIAAARYIPQLDPTNDVAVTAAGAAPILSGYENPVSAGDDWFMIRTMRDVDGTAIIMRGDTFPDPNAADGIEFWIGSGGNFLVHFQPDGQVILPIDPTDAMAAVTKEYVDAAIAAIPPSAGGPPVDTGATPPATPEIGDLWFDPDEGQLYVWFEDANSSQWVVVVNQAAIAQGLFLPLGGGTLTGPLNSSAPITTSSSVAAAAVFATTLGGNPGGTTITAAGLNITGRTDGSNAPAGIVGEVIQNAPGNSNVTNGVAGTLGSITLTPGDWDVYGEVNFNISATATMELAAGYLTPTVNSVTGAYTQVRIPGINNVADVFQLGIPAVRLMSAASLTVNLTVVAGFGGSPCTCSGFVYARRAR